ncbi:GNAT family N-acetyltransferase [Kitasatospora sp. NPDC088391]|uniref:GNAT family N-acetyltransferase n=1 Tax=Kitasatospora sp. NPDC088391 TaxID=3364074 RepID=UPI0038009C48
MKHIIRPVAAEDWALVKSLRLDALQDPLAGIAFLETYEAALARPDEFWQQRAAGGWGEVVSRQFVAERADGGWDGSVTVLIERAGGNDVLGEPTDVDQAHLVGVFVRPEQRGTGLARELFAAAVEFVHGLADPAVSRVRLFVHQDNTRAEAFYRRIGFAPSGLTHPAPGDGSAVERELVLSEGGIR